MYPSVTSSGNQNLFPALTKFPFLNIATLSDIYFVRNNLNSHNMRSHFEGQGPGHTEAGAARGEPEGGVGGVGHDVERGGGGGLAQVPGEPGVMAAQQLRQGVNIHKVVIVKMTPPQSARAQEILELLFHFAAKGQSKQNLI